MSDRIEQISPPNPERHTSRRRPQTVGNTLAAGALLIGAYLPSPPANETSPLADGITPPPTTSPCQLTAPRCPTPTPSPTTEKPPIVTLPSVCDWSDQDGKRQPPVHHNPLIVVVDGRCSPTPNAPVKIHEYPDLNNSPAVDTVKTGHQLLVLCMLKTNTYYQDIRGRQSASNVVLRVQTQNEHVGYISEPPVGYIDETQEHLPRCQFDE